MKITKFGHSCVLVEDGGKRLLFDPGLFVFIENNVSFEDIGPVDVIAISHSHSDHFLPSALSKLYELHPFSLVASEDIVEDAKKEGLKCNFFISEHDTEIEVEGFKLLPQVHRHEQIPMPVPKNTGYLVNSSFYHTGDSYLVSDVMKGLEVITVPNGGPWSTTLQSVEFLKQVRPKIALPIHDGMHKDFWLERLNDSMYEWSSELGVEYRVLSTKDSIEI